MKYKLQWLQREQPHCGGRPSSLLQEATAPVPLKVNFENKQ
jgi:hypothetical protein